MTCVSFSNDKQCILVATLDSSLRLADRVSADILSTYRGHRNQQYRVESMLTRSDAYVISGSEDGKAYLWDLVEVCVCLSAILA